VSTVTEMVGHVARVRDIQAKVMKVDQHYGTIPGTDKPTLLKPGAELLCLAFHIGTSYEIHDESTSDCRRYRVTCVGRHQGTGAVLGEGIGSCSTNEAKYKWRRCYNDREWNSTDESRRKIRYGYSKRDRKEYEERIIRTEPDDLDNTVLKMATKRALVAMVLAVTAASDVFAQDLEELPEGVELDAPATEPRRASKPRTQAPQARPPAAPRADGAISDSQERVLEATLVAAGVTRPELCEAFGIETLAHLPVAKINDALEWARIHSVPPT
jgi:hypothetical protein